MSFWIGKKVLITGGCGFVGSHLAEKLVKEGATIRAVDDVKRGKRENLKAVEKDIEIVVGDLSDPHACAKVCKGMEIVMHLAAKIRGIGYNVNHHGEMFHSNAIMNINMMEETRKADVERLLYVSTVGVYPSDSSVPTPEEDAFKGDPSTSEFGYGWAKRMGEIQSRCYKDEYGMKIAIVRPFHVYGPRDDFNLETAPVVPSQIRKVLEAKDVVTVWGNGEQTRAFTYVADEVAGMMLAVEKYPVSDPLNIGTDEEIKIKDLVKLIVELSGRDISIEFDLTKPSGAPRRCADISKARELIGYKPAVSIKEGLKHTIAWYKEREGIR
jgi:GDP-L-fucose synthase